MIKTDHTAHVPSSRFDLNTLPTCGARIRSGGSCKHKGNNRNGRCKRHGGASTGPINQTVGKNHHRYVHGLRTKEVIAMRKMLFAMRLLRPDLDQ
jgi:hypothetical protein